MAFGKTFVLSLVTFLGLNFVFVIIIAALSGSIGTFFPDLLNPLSNLGSALFGPIGILPGAVAVSIPIAFAPFDLVILLGLIFFIVAPLLASIIAGRLGESRGECFGAWFLVAMVSMGVYLTLILVAGVPPAILIYTIVITIIFGLINGFFYGCFALLFAKSEFY
jgi:hypothetical protein